MTKTIFKIDLNNFPDWAEINWIQFEIDNSLEALKKLQQINTEAFNTIYNDLEAKVSKLRVENRILKDQELEQYTEHLYGLEQQIILELNNVQSSSIIIYSFTIFENKLKMICSKIQKDFQFDLLGKKSSSYTSEYWRILKSFSESRIKTIEKYFTPIKCQMILRNIIIHQNNIAKPEQYKTIRNLNGLVFNEFKGEYYLINVDNMFIEQLIQKLEDFFRELIEILKSESNDRLRNAI